MAQTILNGGTKTTQDQYTGPENELTVDQSNRNLRLHDGTTPGGYAILSRDNADARYQLKSPELDGLVGFEPQQRGILVRLGPADYRLRSITVDSDNLVVSNANGYTGNPLIGLSPTIESEHTWNGQHIFNAVVQFNAGINADVAGDLTGNVLGNVTGNVVGNLTGNAAGNHTGTFTGDGDFRGFDILFDDDQIPTSKIADLINFIKLHGFPAGAICMWSGIESEIPDGWYICNGLNSTPDLRNRFIVGAGTGGNYAPAAVGGFDEQFPTVEIYNGGSHTHSLSGATLSSVTGISLSKTMFEVENEQSQENMVKNVTLTDPGHTHSLGGQADTNGVHNHTGDVSSLDNRPPYYALCYIMKG